MSLGKDAFEQIVFSDQVSQGAKEESVLPLIEILKQADFNTPPLASIVALYLIDDLYDTTSGDGANARRIGTNLEIVADKLLMLSHQLKDAVND